ncbi:hypothetical protein CONLIGDRAFT_646615 [Coniochaeta ligniaria NRRL 30616]|uniref:Uncharacterized protein n=1 Tax=Coniochaeta ligniaria NRRL 30616 TaxID=1408157 RepID=A0A1J7JB46_9PEZI|nr:hypothetical protein CONLIGDRAFT_646615 [Coniochaeta ligniaria NRRL 30616]
MVLTDFNNDVRDRETFYDGLAVPCRRAVEGNIFSLLPKQWANINTVSFDNFGTAILTLRIIFRQFCRRLWIRINTYPRRFVNNLIYVWVVDQAGNRLAAGALVPFPYVVPLPNPDNGANFVETVDGGCPCGGGAQCCYEPVWLAVYEGVESPIRPHVEGDADYDEGDNGYDDRNRLGLLRFILKFRSSFYDVQENKSTQKFVLNILAEATIPSWITSEFARLAIAYEINRLQMGTRRNHMSWVINSPTSIAECNDPYHDRTAFKKTDHLFRKVVQAPEDDPQDEADINRVEYRNVQVSKLCYETGHFAFECTTTCNAYFLGRWGKKNGAEPLCVVSWVGYRETSQGEDPLCLGMLRTVQSLAQDKHAFDLLNIDDEITDMRDEQFETRTDQDHHVPLLCPWDKDLLEYEGLCSHMALNKEIRESTVGMTDGERFERVAEQQKLDGTILSRVHGAEQDVDDETDRYRHGERWKMTK